MTKTIFVASLAVCLQLQLQGLFAQTSKAKSAVVEVTAGRFGGTGVLVDVKGDQYEGRTAAHVVGRNRSISVEVCGNRYPATVTDSKYQGTLDIARFTFRSKRKLPVVRIAPRQPAIGERVWSAGFPGFTNKMIVRQGKRVPTEAGNFSVNYRVSSGDSGSPVFSKDGVVAIIGGTVGSNTSYATQCGIFRGGLFGRRGGCGPGGCGPDEGTTDPGPIIDTPITEQGPTVIDEIAKDIESIDENVEDIEEVLAAPDTEPKSILPVLLVIAVVVGGVVLGHFRNGGK
jgi:hypothetical protein